MATSESLGYNADTLVYRSLQFSRYATEDPTVFVERFQMLDDSSFEEYLAKYETMRMQLIEEGMGAFVPEVVDYDGDDKWIAFGVVEGLYSLKQVLEIFPEGLNGADWAWMARRVLMILSRSPLQSHISIENILVHPENHGIVVLGWAPFSDADDLQLARLAKVTERTLIKSVDSQKQIDFLTKAAESYALAQQLDRDGVYRSTFNYDDALLEYNLKLSQLYGPRRFREFKIDKTSLTPAQNGYLSLESSLIEFRHR